MGADHTDLDLLREDIEKLVLLEEVAERRQRLIEDRLDQALESGINAETIREELKLSKESLRRLLDKDPPDLAERLGISEETVDNLVEPLG
jgi:DNA-binding CsgD family transcriptional regulator